MLDNQELIGIDYDFHSYVILDDDSDMLLHQQDNFVNVDYHVGITEKTVFKARRILRTIYPSYSFKEVQ